MQLVPKPLPTRLHSQAHPHDLVQSSLSQQERKQEICIPAQKHGTISAEHPFDIP
jgi:hypothetical protein